MKTSKHKLCDESFFNSFYLENIQSITNFAFYKCRDKAASLDYVQDAFAKIWENCSKIDFTKAKTYLFTTVNNMFLNVVRHQKVVMAYAKHQPYIDRDNQDPEYLLQEEEFKQRLQNAISGLSDVEREVFLLNRIDGKKYREIAEMLDISQKTVEKRMTGALKFLRKKMDNLKI
ncbi:MAG TPA: sigma-70 family RNA polymerase sigma factor [Flavobacteriaceae bacterium]|nr:sigma-70 family RNA polymerase sigma factor [Flavobacteriaceae bacterium]